MPELKEYMPKTYKLSIYEDLNFEWKKVYKERKKKVSRKRAVYSANAKVYSRLAKYFSKATLAENWKKKKQRNKKLFLNEQKKNISKWNDYEVNDMKIYLSTEREMLSDFPDAERNGKIANMTDAFEQSLISKLMNLYDIKVHPEMFYVIIGE